MLVAKQFGKLNTSNPLSVLFSLCKVLFKFYLPYTIILIVAMIVGKNIIFHNKLLHFDKTSFSTCIFFSWNMLLCPLFHEYAHIANGIVYKGRYFAKIIGVIPGRRIFLKVEAGTTMKHTEYITYLLSGVGFSLVCLLILYSISIIVGATIGNILFIMLITFTMLDILPLTNATDGSQVSSLAHNYNIRSYYIVKYFYISIVNVFKYSYNYKQYAKASNG